MASRVFKTIRSSVPCRISDLVLAKIILLWVEHRSVAEYLWDVNRRENYRVKTVPSLFLSRFSFPSCPLFSSVIVVLSFLNWSCFSPYASASVVIFWFWLWLSQAVRPYNRATPECHTPRRQKPLSKRRLP